jgi:phytoene dehydrogenase-like protein
VNLSPELLQRVRNIRAHGTLAKVNFAVSGVPAFAALAGRSLDEQRAALSGRVRLTPDIDAMERAFDAAKYGSFSDDPWIELTIPSIADPALAPDGQHVVSAYVQFVPFHLRGTTWADQRDRLADVTLATIDRYAPGFARTMLAREVITPADLEQDFGLTGGHIFHGELALDQWYLARPLLGWSRYHTPIRSLFVCGSGTHPGVAGLPGRLAARVIDR